MIKKILFFLTFCFLLGCGSTSTTSLVTTNDSTNSTTNQTTKQITGISTTVGTTEVTTSTSELDLNWFYVSGFAQGYIQDRTNRSYVEVTSEREFLDALNNSDTKIIEIKRDLDLGYYQLNRDFDLTPYSFLRSHTAPLLHPTLLETGVSKIYIQDRDSLMIYSQNGQTIKHASFIVKRCNDIVIRNLKFAELWEFDESTKGNYDRNDWDYFTIDDSNGVWLDHLEFSKAYDGLVDLKNGSKNVTISWSKFVFEPSEFIVSQFNYLEEHRTNYPMYNFLREGGLSIDDIVLLNSSQKKGHLVGSSELEASNQELSLTLHHNLYKNLQDRLPRLRGGNVHLYNILLDNSGLLNTKNSFTYKYPSVMNSGTYKVGLTNQGIVTTENGAVLMENSIFRNVTSPIKNNQKNTELLYTGKYKVINSIYDDQGNIFIGGSSDPYTPFVGKPVSPIEFSWNQLENLPYPYIMTDVNELEALLYEGTVGTLETNLNWLNIKEVVR